MSPNTVKDVLLIQNIDVRDDGKDTVNVSFRLAASTFLFHCSVK